MRVHLAVRMVAVLLGAAALTPSWAQRPCADFHWNVQRERTLFSGPARSLQGGNSAASTPGVQIDQHYALRLSPQAKVQFVVPPGKVMLADGAYAGIVKFSVPRAGTYRVALDAGFWIDVVSQGALLSTQDFQGQHGCANPRKIVEFVMPAGQPLWLQFSGAATPQVQFTLTAAPPAKAA